LVLTFGSVWAAVVRGVELVHPSCGRRCPACGRNVLLPWSDTRPRNRPASGGSGPPGGSARRPGRSTAFDGPPRPAGPARDTRVLTMAVLKPIRLRGVPEAGTATEPFMRSSAVCIPPLVWLGMSRSACCTVSRCSRRGWRSGAVAPKAGSGDESLGKTVIGLSFAVVRREHRNRSSNSDETTPRAMTVRRPPEPTGKRIRPDVRGVGVATRARSPAYHRR